MLLSLLLCTLTLDPMTGWGSQDSLEDRVTHDFAENEGTKIHFVSLGEGPLLVMIHGFPDFWYTWRHQMEVLSKDHQVVAMDLRGYNKSDKPEGIEAYRMPHLVKDVVAVIEHLGVEQATVVGHDWGGAIAWNVAMARPEVVERLIICNLPHPKGLARELAQNEQQQKNSAYARFFQTENAHKTLSAEALASWVTDSKVKAKYIEAFKRSNFESMLAYYKANYPRSDGKGTSMSALGDNPMPKVKAPVLMIHGLDDEALLPAALNDTWEWLEKDLTLVTVPGSGHFVQQDAADMVTRSMRMWLNR